MMYRDELLRKRNPGKKFKSIYPVIFMKFRRMPLAVSNFQFCDYTSFNLTGEAFWKDTNGLLFQKRLQVDVEKLAEIILNAPDWNDEWMIEDELETFHQEFLRSLRIIDNAQPQMPTWGK